MVFGVHLLAKQQAKSSVTVMQILQGHVDEVDEFIQRTTEDFLIIHLDVRTRIQYLSLPLSNLSVFDDMLNDRHFRLSLVSYNDQIEHAVERFTLAITDALKDLQKAKEAVVIFWQHLQQAVADGGFQTESLQPFAQTMMENMDGWMRALTKLCRQGQGLQEALGQLAFTIMEMQRRVGVASRKDVRSMSNDTGATSARSKSIRRKLFSRGSGPGTPGRRSSEKPLPRDPFLEIQTLGTRPASRLDAVGPGAKQSQSSRPNSAMPQVLNRAKSCSALASDINHPPDAPRPPSRSASRLSKAFSLGRPFPSTKRAYDDQPNSLGPNIKHHTIVNPDNRPSTAPASQGPPLDRPKSRWTLNRPQTRQSSRPPQSAFPSTTTPPSDPQDPRHEEKIVESEDTLKEQITHFLKTDRVVEAWDNIAKTANCCGTSIAKTKQWPSSVFRAKASSTADGPVSAQTPQTAPTETTSTKTKTPLRNHRSSSLSRFASRARSKSAGRAMTAPTPRTPTTNPTTTATPTAVKPDSSQVPFPQESEDMNTFFFKKRPSTSPRIHVLSIAIDEELEKSFTTSSQSHSHSHSHSKTESYTHGQSRARARARSQARNRESTTANASTSAGTTTSASTNESIDLTTRIQINSHTMGSEELQSDHGSNAETGSIITALPRIPVHASMPLGPARGSAGGWSVFPVVA
ncbi:hypothetical protein N7539_008102 [Penicillium diatomitis]|uniref:Uncharacterized protein n=1 Tax=Penicillium diatomitis TaxID=2819901 RepID=A0A9W9WTE7_9EURO|nr:uncharacterized protein N7539_008102 [Penicillium diatomitis]KAJ5475036.1 hypothetical protein N7539_008102 [Penicillium diatomitis]